MSKYIVSVFYAVSKCLFLLEIGDFSVIFEKKTKGATVMNKQQLATKIWESANKMRSKIEANEYKDYILGFIFYKYLSDNEVRFMKSQNATDADLQQLCESDEATKDFIQNNIGYFISYENLFSTWLKKGTDFDISNVRDALSAFSRLINPTHKKVFDGIFDTLETGLSKLGDTSGSQTKAVSDLIYLIKDIPMDGKQDYDVLGFIYEYLIGMFAANAGKKAGEFYTPHEISLLMSEIVANHLKDKEEIQIYDPTSGSGSLLINIGRSVAKHMNNPNNIKYYAQELKQNTYNLTRMNLVMRGILPDNIVARNGDTLEADWPYFDEKNPTTTYDPLYVDAVVSNPPYSQNWDPSNKENDPRYARFGLAPKGKADYAFLLHDLYHIKPDGIMTIVLPHGVLFRGGEEGEIRKNLIENNHIDAIIGLPANIFFGTGIPTIIMVLKQRRTNTDVLIVDASKGFIKVGKNNKLQASDIKKIVDTVINRQTTDKYSRVVSRDEIRQNDYNLNIPRYVDSSEAAETWDICASMFGGVPDKEIDELSAYWTAFPNLKTALFEKISDNYSKVKVADIKNAVHDNADVKSFHSKFDNAFASFADFLNKELLVDTQSIPVSKEENILCNDIFARLNDIPLIDKYKAYQLLDDVWGKIAADLEMIQTEGFEATKKVDPLMVVKKDKGKDQERQEGWFGRIIPFDLVQQTLLKDKADSLQRKQDKLSEIASTFEEILDSLSEEDKGNDTVNEENDGFVTTEVKKAAKLFRVDMRKHVFFDEESYEAKIIKIADLIEEEKALKAEVKKENAILQDLTKETIETLTNEQVLDLLKFKWIVPLMQNMAKLPSSILDDVTKNVKSLSEKYETTYSAVEQEIRETEESLATMLNELTGSADDLKGLEEFKSLLKGI